MTVVVLKVAEAELAAAVLLVVELSGEDVAPLVKSALAPVAVPETGKATAALFLSIESGFIDLPDVLPAGGGESGGEQGKSVLSGIGGRDAETVFKAGQASPPALRLALQPLGAFQPSGVLLLPRTSGIAPVQVHNSHPCLMRVPHDLVLPPEVFLLGEDVGVVEQDCRLIAVLPHPFEDGGRTGGAAGVQKHFSGSSFHID